MHIAPGFAPNIKDTTPIETDLTSCLFNTINENEDDFSLSLETAFTKIKKEQPNIEELETAVITPVLMAAEPIQIVLNADDNVVQERSLDTNIEVDTDSEPDSIRYLPSEMNPIIMQNQISSTSWINSSEAKAVLQTPNDLDTTQKPLTLPLMNALYQSRPNIKISEESTQTTEFNDVDNDNILPALIQPEALKYQSEMNPFTASRAAIDKDSFTEQEQKILPALHSENTNADETTAINFKINAEQGQPSVEFSSLNQDFNPVKSSQLQTATPKNWQIPTTSDVTIESEQPDKNPSGTITLHINNKEDIGKITAKIQVINKESVVTFIAETSETKQLLQNHVAHLKEIFNESNISLGQTHIEQHNQRQKQDSSHQQKNTPESFDVEALLNTEKNTNTLQQTNRSIHSLLDTFA